MANAKAMQYFTQCQETWDEDNVTKGCDDNIHIVGDYATNNEM